MEQFHRARQPFALSHGGIVARQYAGRIEDIRERGDYLRSKVFQPRAQKLNDETVRVSIHNEGRKGIALAMHYAICVGTFRYRCTSGEGGANPRRPPGVVEGDARVGVNEAERNLGSGAPECAAQFLSARIHDNNRTRRI
jgi:hypothetical protein